MQSQSRRNKFGFDELIQPMSLRDFADLSESGKPFCIKGEEAKFTGLFDLTRFKTASRKATSVTVSYSTAGRGSMTPSRSILHSEIDAHYLKGGTICVRGLDQVVPRLHALVDNCRHALGFAGLIDCRSYLSGNGAGYTPHFDDKAVLTFQIEGTKKWLASPGPAIDYPLENAGRHPDGIYRYFRQNPDILPWERFDQPQFEETATAYTLRPGDLLMVPSGVWHTACADGHSLSMAITFNHAGLGSAQEIVLSALRNLLITEGRWRRPPPMVLSRNSGQDASSLDELDRFFAARLDDLKKEIDRLQRDRTEIVRVWSSRISS